MPWVLSIAAVVFRISLECSSVALHPVFFRKGDRMKSPRLLLPALTVLALFLASGSSAQAQYGGGCGWGYNYGGFNGSIARGFPPYFSLFPPVYYSYPVPRSYGYSPFAYPFGSPTPEVQVEQVQAKLMVNPFVPRPAVAEPATERTVGGPLLMRNPFVPPVDGGAAELELARKL
jgi:hypothetical protein